MLECRWICRTAHSSEQLRISLHSLWLLSLRWQHREQDAIRDVCNLECVASEHRGLYSHWIALVSNRVQHWWPICSVHPQTMDLSATRTRLAHKVAVITVRSMIGQRNCTTATLHSWCKRIADTESVLACRLFVARTLYTALWPLQALGCKSQCAKFKMSNGRAEWCIFDTIPWAAFYISAHGREPRTNNTPCRTVTDS